MKKHLKVILLIISITFLQINLSYSNEDAPLYQVFHTMKYMILLNQLIEQF